MGKQQDAGALGLQAVELQEAAEPEAEGRRGVGGQATMEQGRGSGRGHMELALREDGSAHVMHSHSAQPSSENGLAMTVPPRKVGPASSPPLVPFPSLQGYPFPKLKRIFLLKFSRTSLLKPTRIC